MAEDYEITPDVVAVYNEHVAVISEHKKSQFQITGYLMALFAGILTWRHEIVGAIPEGLEFVPVFIAPALVGVVGIDTIWRVQKALDRRRDLIASSRKFLTWRAQQVYGDVEKRSHPQHIAICCIFLSLVATMACILILMNET
jgi:hypothetical protein